jgi:hypothetical protein
MEELSLDTVLMINVTACCASADLPPHTVVAGVLDSSPTREKRTLSTTHVRLMAASLQTPIQTPIHMEELDTV